MLQKRLDESPTYVVGMLFEKLSENIPELMTDPFGNYLIQRLIELCDDEQLGYIIQSCTPWIEMIGINAYGTRTI